MSRSSTSVLAIGIGSRDLALGMRRSALQRLRERIRSGRAGTGAQASPPLAQPGVAHATIAMDEAQCFTEQGALEVLRQALAADAGAPGPSPGSKRRAFIVLDDFWANHAILRGDFRGMRAREIDETALAYFADTFGLAGGSLLIRWQLQGGGRALFASAMSRSLHDGIHEVSSSARVEVKSLTLGLPQTLNRVRRAVDGREALLLVVTETLLHAVTMEDNRWAAYDTQRLFDDDAGDALRLAGIAEHMFERSSTTRREDCMVYLCGLPVDPAPFEERFAAALQLPGRAGADAAALRLMEFAQ